MAIGSKPKPKITNTSLNISTETYAEVKAYAEEKGMVISRVIEFAVIAYLKAQKAREVQL
jgi:hypothetical protein